MRIGLDITVLNTPQRTGIAVYTYELIDALLQQNTTDEFILFGISTLSTYEHLSALPFKKYPNVKMKIVKWAARFFKNTFLLWQLLGYPTIESFIGPVDIYHSFNYYLPPQKSGKTVGTVFDVTALTHQKFHLKSTTALDKVRFKRIGQKADLVITISENSKKDFSNIFAHKKVEVVYPGVSENFLQKITAEEKASVLKKYDLHPGYFLSVATLEPRKNLGRLMEAYLATDLNDPLVLVGGVGWKSKEIVDLAKQYPKRIKPLGFVEDKDLPALYNQACCLIYPSLYEGFGIPVLEAMQSGTPVITSHNSSLPEVGGEAVIYVNPLDIQAISKQMIELKNSASKREKLIKKGLEQAKKFSFKKSAEKVNNFYHTL